MHTVQVKIDTAQIERLAKEAGPKKAGQAIARGLTDAIKQGRTAARSEIRRRYNIPLTTLTRQGRGAMMRIGSAKPANLSAKLFADVKQSIPLAKFAKTSGAGVTVTHSKKHGTRLKRGRKYVNQPKTTNPRDPVSIEVVKGKRQTMGRAFIARMKSGHIGVFGRAGGYKGGNFNYRTKRARSTGNDTPIVELSAFTLHKAVDNRHTENAIASKMETAAPRRVKFWLERKLGRV